MARRRIPDRERRARLVAHHHLRRTAPSVEAAVTDLVVLHSSDPVTPPLQLWARVPELTLEEVDRALHVDRTLWRLHAMRRTLFVTSTERAPVLLGACARDVASAERRKLEGWLAAALDGDDPAGWLRAVEERTVAELRERGVSSTRELAAAVPGLDRRVTVGSGRWTSEVAVSSRVLFLLALDARIVRTEPAGTWISSQYRWAERERWFGEQDLAVEGSPAVALAEAYLGAHGPAASADLGWWAGWGKRATAAALAGCGAVAVALDGGAEGWVLPGDAEADHEQATGVALLPSLDSTVMGWKERGWYLGAHAGRLFDRNGNAGPTAWVDGRVVGGWAVRPSGEVVVGLLDDVGEESAAALDAEAAALTAWLGGTAPTPRFRTPLERELSTG